MKHADAKEELIAAAAEAMKARAELESSMTINASDHRNETPAIKVERDLRRRLADRNAKLTEAKYQSLLEKATA